MSCIKQSPGLQLSLPRRILIFILGFLDNLLFGGAVFGWPQLVFVLKVEGLYGDLCDSFDQNSTESNSNQFFLNLSHCTNYNQSADNNSTLHQEEFQNVQKICEAQDEKFALIYTLAVVCYGIPGVLVGYMLHYAGLMVTRMLGGFMVASSFVFLAITTFESPNWLFAATVLLSMGGNQLRMSNMQFGDLFPKARSTTITVLTGVYAASASLFILFPIGASFGISRPLICYCLAIYSFVSAVASVVMPCHHIPYENDNEGYDVKERKRTSSSTLWESLKTMSSLLHLYWFLILLVCVNFYQQIYNLWITASTCSEEEVGLYSSLFSYSNIVSVFCAPIGGMFTDFCIRRAKRKEVDRVSFLTKEIQANFTPLFLTTLFTMVMHCCLFFFSETSILISLVSMIIVRPCVVAISTAYLRIRFPGSHFNRLLGIYCTIASAFMFVQYPFFKLAQDNYYLAQGILLFMLAISFLNPLHILWTSRVKRWVKERDNLTDDEVLVQNFTKSI